MSSATGRKLERLVGDSDETFVVVSPFITRPAFKRLVGLLGRRPLVVVTDWRPGAVAAGATDPRIINDTAPRRDTELWLMPSLHGKLYWTKQGALVGSTNLTARGTGWFGPGNLELLVTVSADDQDVQVFVKTIMEFRVWATAADADAALKAAESLPAVAYPLDETPTPLLRTPAADFFEEYATGQPLSPNAGADAKVLNIPAGLDTQGLIPHVQRQLRALPYCSLATYVSRRTGSSGDISKQRNEFRLAVHAYGLEEPRSEADADHAWAVLMTWMEYFLPKEFTSLETGSRVLVNSAGTF